MSITTLEEVFLMVGRGELGTRTLLDSSLKETNLVDKKGLIDLRDGQGYIDEPRANVSYNSAEEITSQQLFSRHFQALLQKRALNFKRDKKAWVRTALLAHDYAVFLDFFIID